MDNSDLIRELFGNPFRPVSLDAAWQTPTVLALATAAYDNRILPAGTLEPARLNVLADALEEAGCDSADILNHCRQPGEHEAAGSLTRFWGRSKRSSPPGNHPTPDILAIDPADPVNPGDGGMSVAPDNPAHLQKHRRPVSLGGIGLDPVWYIEASDLVALLEFRQDKSTHGVIQPRQTMSRQKFEDALAQTRTHWHLHCR